MRAGQLHSQKHTMVGYRRRISGVQSINGAVPRLWGDAQEWIKKHHSRVETQTVEDKLVSLLFFWHNANQEPPRYLWSFVAVSYRKSKSSCLGTDKKQRGQWGNRLISIHPGGLWSLSYSSWLPPFFFWGGGKGPKGALPQGVEVPHLFFFWGWGAREKVSPKLVSLGESEGSRNYASCTLSIELNRSGWTT